MKERSRKIIISLEYVLLLLAIIVVSFLVFYSIGASASDDSTTAKISADPSDVCADPTGCIYTYTYNYHYPNGALVYASVIGPDGGTATAMPDEILVYGMKVTNMSSSSEYLDLEFDLPSGFTYIDMVNSSDPDPDIANTEKVVWNNFEATVPERTIYFKVRVP